VGRCTGRYGFEWYKYAKARLRAVMLLTLKGTPFIYYGDEIGMENTHIPKRKINDLYGKLFWPFYKGRDKSRTPMQWNNSAHAGFSSEEPWLPVNKNYRTINVESESEDPQSVFSIYKNLIALRNKQEVLQSGEIKFLSKGKHNILAYSRYLGNKKIIVILNFSSFRKKYKPDMGDSYEILFSTHKTPCLVKDDSISLYPFEGIIMEVKPA
jgi:alpha-glucosidase